MNKTVTVRVPATTANCGPGFDAVGIACTLYNQLALTITKSGGVQIKNLGEGSDLLPTDETNITYQAIQSVFTKQGYTCPGLSLTMTNTIPLARGLGSSAAAIVAGLYAANEILGSPLTKAELLDMATAFEGHPDNVAPALYGGIAISAMNNAKVETLQLLPPRPLSLVVAVPAFFLATKTARQVLPKQVSLADAVFNVSRTALMVGALATRLAGSSDIFARTGQQASRSVNFIAAHDGMTLADIVAYERKHNEANGEQNRDGHDENLSWNNGVEGETGDGVVSNARLNDERALLATLFASRGTIMLTAGDEFGRTQKGNNNAYAQDNETTWLDWQARDQRLERYAVLLSAMRRAAPSLCEARFLTGQPSERSDVPDVAWLSETGIPPDEAGWNDPERTRLAMVRGRQPPGDGRLRRSRQGDRRACVFTLPSREGFMWMPAGANDTADISRQVPGRTVIFMIERKAGQPWENL